MGPVNKILQNTLEHISEHDSCVSQKEGFWKFSSRNEGACGGWARGDQEEDQASEGTKGSGGAQCLKLP